MVVIASSPQLRSMKSLTERYLEYYTPLIQEVIQKRELLTIPEIKEMPEPFLPLFGKDYEQSALRIIFIGQDTRWWWDLREFIRAEKASHARQWPLKFYSIGLMTPALRCKLINALRRAKWDGPLNTPVLEQAQAYLGERVNILALTSVELGEKLAGFAGFPPPSVRIEEVRVETPLIRYEKPPPVQPKAVSVRIENPSVCKKEESPPEQATFG